MFKGKSLFFNINVFEIISVRQKAVRSGLPYTSPDQSILLKKICVLCMCIVYCTQTYTQYTNTQIFCVQIHNSHTQYTRFLCN